MSKVTEYSAKYMKKWENLHTGDLKSAENITV